MVQDIINGCFGLLGATLAYQNVREAKASHNIEGVHWYSTMFFALWGLWNLYLYPFMNMWFSFVGSLAIVLVDSYWVYLYFKFRKP